MSAHTHRTLQDAIVESRSGHHVERRLVPAGTTGVIEYFGVIGGEPCVVFRGGGMETNLMARGELQVERLDMPQELRAAA